MKDNEYQCDMCKGIFEKGWSDEEAKQEAEEIFGKNPNEWNDEQKVVCDDCFNKINPTAEENSELLERTKKVI